MSKVKTPNVRKRQDGRFEGRIVVGNDPKTGKPIRRSIYGHTVAEVEQQLNLVRLALGRGDYVAPCRLTLQEWSVVWFDTFALPRIGPASAQKYRATLDNHILPALGAIPLPKIKSWHIQSLYNSLTPGAARNAGAVLGQLFDVAIKQQYIYSNPCAGATLPKAEKKETPPLQESEASALVEVAQGTRWENAIIVALLCGHRTGELLGLSWNDIDFEAGKMTVKQQLTRQRKLTATKTGKSRTFTMPPAVVQALQRERRAQMEQQLKAGPCWNNEFSLVFTDELGAPIVANNFFRAVKKFGQQIGRSDLSPHALRHYCATAALAAGVSVKSVQNLLGHSSAVMTADIYAENTDGQSADTAAKIQARFEANGVKMGSIG